MRGMQRAQKENWALLVHFSFWVLYLISLMRQLLFVAMAVLAYLDVRLQSEPPLFALQALIMNPQPHRIFLILFAQFSAIFWICSWEHSF